MDISNCLVTGTNFHFTMYKHIFDNSIIDGYIHTVFHADGKSCSSQVTTSSYGYTVLNHCQSADLVFSAANLHGVLKV